MRMSQTKEKRKKKKKRCAMSGVDTSVPVLVRHEFTELVVRQRNVITIIATRCGVMRVSLS